MQIGIHLNNLCLISVIRRGARWDPKNIGELLRSCAMIQKLQQNSTKVGHKGWLALKVIATLQDLFTYHIILLYLYQMPLDVCGCMCLCLCLLHSGWPSMAHSGKQNHDHVGSLHLCKEEGRGPARAVRECCVESISDEVVEISSEEEGQRGTSTQEEGLREELEGEQALSKEP